MSDTTIVITDLEVWMRIGVPAEERAREQRVLLTIEIDLSVCNARETDRIEDTVNYDDVIREIRVLATKEWHTLEHASANIAQTIIAQNNAAVSRVTVIITKCAIPGIRKMSLHTTLTQTP